MFSWRLVDKQGERTRQRIYKRDTSKFIPFSTVTHCVGELRVQHTEPVCRLYGAFILMAHILHLVSSTLPASSHRAPNLVRRLATRVASSDAATYPVFCNGAWRPASDATISVGDVGLLRGYGIFDFLRVVDRRPVFLSDHISRFLASAEKMNLRHSLSRAHLERIVGEIASQSHHACLGVKLVLTGGESPNGFEPSGDADLLVLAAPFTFADPSRGLSLLSREYVREQADIKTLNYSFALRHWPAVKAGGHDDLLYHTRSSGVSESSRSNLFFVKSGVICTPADGVLCGITREHVLRLATAAGLPVRVGGFPLNDFLTADEVFTTGTTKRVCPVSHIDGRIVGPAGGGPGPVTQRLYELLIEAEKA
jgi:branched-chain amino acid aminotransferase